MADAPDTIASPARRRSLATPAWMRRLRYWFSREKLREFVTTLGLVVPLTFLIWIWAEREQTLERDVQVTVDVRSRNPNAVVSLVRPDDKPGPASVSLRLSGPKAGIDALQLALANDPSRGRLTLEVADDVGVDGTRDVAIAALLDQQTLFGENGIAVRAAEPDTVKVRADPVVTEDFRPSLPTDVATRVEKIETEPATVRVRGSAQAIERLRRDGKLRAELDTSAQPTLRDTVPGKTVTLANLPIRPINAPGVTLESTSVGRATLTFSATREATLASVVVNVNQPAGLFARVRVLKKDRTLPDVQIVGPPDVLQLLARAERDGTSPESMPYATLRITRDDLNKSGLKRVPTLENLPRGVSVGGGGLPAVTFDVEATTDDGR